MRRFRKLGRRMRSESGQAYLEFVIGIPILFCMLFLMMDFLAIGHSVSQTVKAAYSNSRENTNAGQGLPDAPDPTVYYARFKQSSLGLPSNASVPEGSIKAYWQRANTRLSYFSNQAWLVTQVRLRYRPIIMGMFSNYQFSDLYIRGWDYRLNEY